METTSDPGRPLPLIAQDIEIVLAAFFAPGDSQMNEQTVAAAERLAEDAERMMNR